MSLDSDRKRLMQEKTLKCLSSNTRSELVIELKTSLRVWNLYRSSEWIVSAIANPTPYSRV